MMNTKDSWICKLSQKKGTFDTVVTIFSILFLVFVFMIFAFLFSAGAKQKQATTAITSSYSSLNTELMLKTFLESPAYNLNNNNPKDLTSDVGNDRPTNANLVSWTCSNNINEPNYKALKSSMNNFFDAAYKNHWELWIVYSNQNIKRKSFGRGATSGSGGLRGAGVVATAGDIADLSSQEVFNQVTAKASFTPITGGGRASQVIPCYDGSLAAVLFQSNIAYLQVDILK